MNSQNLPGHSHLKGWEMWHTSLLASSPGPANSLKVESQSPAPRLSLSSWSLQGLWELRRPYLQEWTAKQ